MIETEIYRHCLGHAHQLPSGGRVFLEESINEAALAALKLKAKNGSLDAKIMLGRHFKTISEKKSFKYFSLASAGGNISANLELADCYFLGIGTSRNLEKALYLYKPIAKSGCMDAQYRLGQIYFEKELFSKAFKYYFLSASQEFPQAHYALGKIFSETKNKSALEQVCEQKDCNSMMHFAYQFYMRKNLKKDTAKTAELLKNAADCGDASAQLNLGCFYCMGVGVEVNYEKAAHYYSLASKQENSIANFYLSLLYAKGQGVPKNLSLAVEYCEKASKGFFMARKILPKLYLILAKYYFEECMDYMSTQHYILLAEKMGEPEAASGRKLLEQFLKN